MHQFVNLPLLPPSSIAFEVKISSECDMKIKTTDNLNVSYFQFYNRFYFEWICVIFIYDMHAFNRFSNEKKKKKKLLISIENPSDHLNINYYYWNLEFWVKISWKFEYLSYACCLSQKIDIQLEQWTLNSSIKPNTKRFQFQWNNTFK